MYMTHTAADHRVHMGLPADYTVDGTLAYGTWDLVAETDHIPQLRSALDATGLDYRLTRIDEPLIGHAHEVLLEGSKRYWFIPVMGTAVMGMYLHLASLFGSRRNILLGTVGGLAPGMRNGDLVVPTAVAGNDSARMYARAGIRSISALSAISAISPHDDPITDAAHRPDPGLLARLTTELGDRPGLWFGPTTTCEVMLAETQEDVDGWSRSGMLGVEMEAALTFALSWHFGIPAVALFYVVDNLIERETVLSPSHESYRSRREQQRATQYRVGVKLLLE